MTGEHPSPDPPTHIVVEVPSTVPLLSVVVPVYNAERYLADCLASIGAQSLTEIEIIVVDDGSSDGSLAVAESIAEQDPRFRVIPSTNGGASRARNIGLSAARGTYVTFVDADDWVSPTMYEELLEPTDEHPYDAVAGDLMIESQRGSLRIENSRIAAGAYDAARIRTEIWPILVSSSQLTREWPYRLVTKVFRREHLRENDLWFVPGLRAAQDFVFSVAAMSRAGSFFYRKGSAGYHYRWNPGSRTRSSLSTAWENYRAVDRALEEAVPAGAEFDSQLKLAELHGDLSALTYLYRNCRLRDSGTLYRTVTVHLSSVDRRPAFDALDWAGVPMGKRVVCRLMQHRRYRLMHGLLLSRGVSQNLRGRLTRVPAR